MTPKNHLNKVPLKAALIIPFVALTILAVGLVGYLSFRNGQIAVNDVALQLRSEISNHIQTHLRNFLALPQQINQTNADAMQRKQLDVTNPKELERHFWQQVKTFTSVTSVYFGNPQGGLVNSGREGAMGDQYVIATDGFKSGSFNKFTTDENGNRGELLVTVPNFDARTRQWYSGAVAQGGNVWSPVYIVFTGDDLAIAASQPVYDDQHQLLGVTSVDLFLSHISNFLKSFKIGKNGSAFLIDRSGLMIATSTTEKLFTEPQNNDQKLRVNASESATPLIRHAAKSILQRFGDYHDLDQQHNDRFEIDGAPHFLQVSPLQDQYGLDWLIVVVVPEADFMAQIETNNFVTATLIIATAFLVILLGVVIGRRIAKPIMELNEAALTLAKGEWQQKIQHEGQFVELELLSRSFNQMANQLQQMLDNLNGEIGERKRAEIEQSKLEAQLKQAHKMEAIGTLAGGVAHDFNNILGIIIGNTELAERAILESNSAKTNLEEIKIASLRARDLVKQLLSFSRKSEQRWQALNIAPVINEAIKLLRATIPSTIAIRSDIAPSLGAVKADPTQIQQVVINLCTNAAHAMEQQGGLLEISLTQIALDEKAAGAFKELGQGQYIQLSVKDSGQGIDPEIQSKIFDPYFTTKEVGKGTGMGLAIVHGILVNHGGGIAITSELNKGTAVNVVWPVCNEEIVEPAIVSNVLATGNERILFVDDEEPIVEMTKEMLEILGYRVDTRLRGDQAIALFRSKPDQFDLVMTDMTMPEMTGVQLAEEIMRIRRDIPIIICTGHSAKIDEERARKMNIAAFITKPVLMNELAQTIRKVLDGFVGAAE